MRSLLIAAVTSLSVCAPAALAELRYAVVVSKQTDTDPQWHKVVQALADKHHADVITFDGDIATARDALAKEIPIYTGIVARPDELGRGFIAKTHRMMRRLDADPYTDTIWGIVTGLTADDALALVADRQPLEIKRVISTTGVNAGLFEQMFTVSDGAEGQWTFKAADGTIYSGGVADDAERRSDRAVLFAKRFDEIKPDLIVSSSHGFENGIEMPWGHGMLIGRNGDLAILPQNPGKDGAPGKGLGKPVKLEPSTNPKVFLPVGNCLVGHIDPKHTKDSLILALQRNAAVRQSIGYTIETWYGRGGWGMLELLQSQPERLTVAEAWFINQQQIVEQLRTKHPKAAAFDYDWSDKSSVNSFMSAAQKAGLNANDKDEMGLAFDRDVVALYGDPAYSARIVGSSITAPYQFEFASSDGIYTLTVSATDPKALQNFHGPLVFCIPNPCPDPSPLVEMPHGAVLADNFLIIPEIGRVIGNDPKYTFRFGSKQAIKKHVLPPT